MDAFEVVKDNHCKMVGWIEDQEYVEEFNGDMGKFCTLLEEYVKTKEGSNNE